jgi:hypothetical protein
VADLAVEEVWVSPTGDRVHVDPGCRSLRGRAVRKSASVLHRDTEVCRHCGGDRAGGRGELLADGLDGTRLI